MNILDKLVTATKKRIERDKTVVGLEEAVERCAALPVLDFEFKRALEAPGMSFICEVKRASPSKGIIWSPAKEVGVGILKGPVSDGFPYLDIAKAYEEGGAACISVLTETDYFLGSDRYLEEIAKEVPLPVLRKDFIIEPYQIYQARLLGAKAVLLIRAILEPVELLELAKLAERLGMTPLVEVHDKYELSSALDLGIKLIGVNNRDLKTFEVNIKNSIALREMTPGDVTMVAESGIRSRDDIITLERAGIDAVLIGEALIRGIDIRKELELLRCG